MSDEQLPTRPVEDEAKTRLAIENIYAKTKSAPCPLCGNIKWFFLNSPENKPVLIFLDLRSFSTYALTCTNCGFIRQHLSAIVDGVIVGETSFRASGEQPDVE